MKNSQLYTNYLSKLEEALNSDNFENIDFILESIYSSGLQGPDLDKIDDILQEATLYSELKDEDYKEGALEFIEEFKS